jgi:hypothetical protein
VLVPSAHRVALVPRAAPWLALSIEGPCWTDQVTAVPSRAGHAAELTISRRCAETIVEDLRIAGPPGTEAR